MIRAVIVDDEPLSRTGVLKCLASVSDVRVVGEARDGPEAIDLILRQRPDLVFLDVQIPGFDGFEVASRIREDHLPALVFVSAYDRYALRAFDVHAVDYLLKPYSDERFHEALARARRELLLPGPDRLARLLALLSDVAPAGINPAYVERFTVRDRDAWHLVRALDVDWFESAANYVQIRAGDQSHLVRMTMNQLERSLDPQRFARIHRTTIVNLDRIREVRADVGEGYLVILRDGRTLAMSRRYRDRILG